MRAIAVVAAAMIAAPGVAQWVEAECESLLEVTGSVATDLYGWTAVPLGDVDGDGTPDLAVSAGFTGVSAGSVYAISGADGGLIWTRSETLSSSILGYSMETIDWNGDGTIDVVAAAPFNGATGGRVWVYDGADGATLDIINPGDVSNDGFGCSVSTGGDFNGDGIADVLVGSLGWDHPLASNAGRVYVYSSGDGALIATIDGTLLDGELGLGTAFVGDVTVPPDGRDEIAVGRRGPTFFEGETRVYTWDGAAPQMLYAVTGAGMGYNLLSDRIDGGKDVNDDGVPDFMVGDMFLDMAFVFSGVDGSIIRTFDGDGQGGSFGTGHLIDDVDNDGHADIALGAWSNDTGADGAGKVFVYSGAEGSVIRTMTYTAANGHFGIETRAFGDFDGDGTGDFLVGATGGGFNGPPTGRVFIVRGIPAPAPIGDIDGDGSISTVDLLLLLAVWGSCGDCGSCAADLDGDCAVGISDVGVLLGNWR